MSRVIVGTRAVLEALRSGTSVRAVYATGRYPDEVARLAKDNSTSVEGRSREDLDRLAEGVRHQGIVAIADDYRYLTLDELVVSASPPAIVVALDEITDPQNFGAIVRSAVALGVHGLVIQKHRAAGVTTASTKASAGATEHARIARVTNLQKTLLALSESGFQIVGLDAAGDVGLDNFELTTGAVVLVVGSEGRGLRRMVRERCDTMVEIPLAGPVSSLNASVAAAIAMHHFCTLAHTNRDTDDQQ